MSFMHVLSKIDFYKPKTCYKQSVMAPFCVDYPVQSNALLDMLIRCNWFVYCAYWILRRNFLLPREIAEYILWLSFTVTTDIKYKTDYFVRIKNIIYIAKRNKETYLELYQDGKITRTGTYDIKPVELLRHYRPSNMPSNMPCSYSETHRLNGKLHGPSIERNIKWSRVTIKNYRNGKCYGVQKTPQSIVVYDDAGRSGNAVYLTLINQHSCADELFDDYSTINSLLLLGVSAVVRRCIYYNDRLCGRFDCTFVRTGEPYRIVCELDGNLKIGVVGHNFDSNFPLTSATFSKKLYQTLDKV